jgi:hypothetical protein
VATAQGEASNASRPGNATGGCQAEGMGFMVKVAPSCSTLSPGRVPYWINANAVHSGQINHDATVTYCKAWNTMPTTTDRYQKMVGPGEIDGVNHIGNPNAAGDQRWVSVDHPIMDLANKVIGLAAGVEQFAPQVLLEFFGHCLW